MTVEPTVRLLLRGAMAAGLLLSAGPGAAQTLGRIDFPATGKAEAHPHFIRGVLLMHSFEYARAAAAFRDAQQADPGFVMAYWGEALTHTHPIWNQKDVAAARAVLARLGPTTEARLAKAPTPRERAWLEAVEVLYGEGPKPRLDTLYAEAMERVMARHPDDESKTFYALALLGLSQGARVVPTYMRAGAIAQEVLVRNPEHPGAAHYVIHAFDDPVHAPLGLAAARAYTPMAQDAPHAQHMTTHIYLAMGMWDDVIAQNIVASGHDHDRWGPGHYTSWLGYGLAQAGRFTEARDHLHLVRKNLREMPGPGGYLVDMRAQYVINSERWDDPSLEWPAPPAAWPVSRAVDAFTLGYAAVKRGDAAGAERHRAALESASRSGDAAVVGGLLHSALRAAQAAAAGRADEAVALLHRAAAVEDTLPVEFGPPAVVKPTRELLGEIHLAAGRPADARRAFERSLEMGPKRWLSLRGLARAARAAGDAAAADRACADWRAIWHKADAPVRDAACGAEGGAPARP